jgi:Sec-independent protein secretion pathway component TatC
MGIAIAIIALVIVGGLIGAALNFMAPWLGIPLSLLFIGGIIAKEQMERQNRILRMKRFRREARAQPIDFDAGDKRTLV